MTAEIIVIAGLSSIDGPKEPLPGPLRQRPDSAHGIRLFAAVYAKQGCERQDIVRFLPGFRPKVESGAILIGAITELDRLNENDFVWLPAIGSDALSDPNRRCGVGRTIACFANAHREHIFWTKAGVDR
ncbi:hypothetical protein NKJ90_05125 [Mesorhizobium sp. M0051]|uniref:hypothetical protein n=1 Tax=unclassified Mesorhizobium TaxID=325217 RepID=UPI0012EC7FC8|nr:hypothetical protein [Mesorhizobium sp. LNHC252B00]